MFRPVHLTAQLEEEVLARDVRVYTIPWGDQITLFKGQSVLVSPASGIHFNLLIAGVPLYLLAQDSDAINRTRINLPSDDYLNNQDFCPNVSHLWQQISYIYDPEISVNIVDLGLIYSLAIKQNEAGYHSVTIKMTLTSPTCGMGPIIIQSVRDVLLLFPWVKEVHISLVFDPPWHTNMMSDKAKLMLGLI